MQDLSRTSSGTSSTFSAENKDSTTILKGQPVAIHSSGTGIVRANATNNTKNTIGLAGQDVAQGFSSPVSISGPFSMADWTNVTGSSLLASIAVYYLDTVAGKLTTTPPVATGNVVQFVGRALAPDTLDLAIEQTTLL